jgi:hypothetical protein
MHGEHLRRRSHCAEDGAARLESVTDVSGADRRLSKILVDETGFFAARATLLPGQGELLEITVTHVLGPTHPATGLMKSTYFPAYSDPGM